MNFELRFLLLKHLTRELYFLQQPHRLSILVRIKIEVRDSFLELLKPFPSLKLLSLSLSVLLDTLFLRLVLLSLDKKVVMQLF